MNTVVLVLIIVGASLAFVFVLSLILKTVFDKLRKKSQGFIDAQFETSEILLSDPMANFFGQQSKGGAQIRGNGGLVLTKDTLWFHLLVPDRELVIPLNRVTGVRSEKWFLKKSKGRLLLIVDFETDQGPDAVGWLVREHQTWMEHLKKSCP